MIRGAAPNPQQAFSLQLAGGGESTSERGAIMKKLTTSVGIGCLTLCLGMASAQSASADDDVTLSGCLVRSSDDSGYLIANAPAEVVRSSQGDNKVSPDAFGGAGGFASVFYWLESSDSLKPHVGHFVEVQGDLKDPKDGELKVERKDKWTEVELKSDGRTLQANVPNTSVVPGPSTKDTKANVIVRRVSVEKVKMLGANCTP